MCLRRSMYDQHARRAALDSSLDDDQHELLTSVRIIVHNRTRLSTLKMNSSSRSSSSRLARAHERAGRGRAGRASKRGHRGHTVRSLLVCWRAQSCCFAVPRQLPVLACYPFSFSTEAITWRMISEQYLCDTYEMRNMIRAQIEKTICTERH